MKVLVLLLLKQNLIAIKQPEYVNLMFVREISHFKKIQETTEDKKSCFHGRCKLCNATLNETVLDLELSRSFNESWNRILASPYNAWNSNTS